MRRISIRDQDLRVPHLRIVPSETTPLEREAVLDFFRSYLKQVVGIHQVMFEKLLAEDTELPLELAELFEDAGNTYIRISERISEDYLLRDTADVE